MKPRPGTDLTIIIAYLEEVIWVVLGVSIVQQELQAAVDCVEETVHNHFIHVVHIRLPDVQRLFRLEQLQVFLWLKEIRLVLLQYLK